jgi:hypothetical protein
MSEPSESSGLDRLLDLERSMFYIYTREKFVRYESLKSKLEAEHEIVERLREIDIEYIINLITKQGIIQGDRQSKILKLRKLQSILKEKEE